MSQPKVCVVGSSNMDLNSYVSRLPKSGETILGERFETGYGGKGANQAVMAARLGADVTFIAKVGDDMFGQDMLTNFKHEGMITEHIYVTDQASTGVAAISIDDQGNNCIIVSSGANYLLTEDEIEAASEAICDAQVLVCQLEVPLAVTMAALHTANSAGVITILNPAPAAQLPDDIYGLCDIFCPNETELELLTGRPVETVEQIEEAARLLLDHGTRQVLVTMGSRGTLLIVEDGGSKHFATSTVDAVDTTGAGDAFVGSLAYLLAAGHTLEQAIPKANQIASVSVQSPGAQSSFPRRSDLSSSLL